ncbi:unnamed protein product [Coffea canephora]|uniref:peptide-methionine (S)-S-oxide reductase n=1 Tax=Coffea canephora TaxID=49390 RepID=A0A068U575_COFCA|nr:unnamed protein product [Coffea canephora]
MYKLLAQTNSKAEIPDYLIESPSAASCPSEFLSDAVFAGDKFWDLEAAYGRVDGVVKTAAGFCGGRIRKPSYREVCEGKSGHTEAVKVTYDKRKIAYGFLCDMFWETHDPTNKDLLNFGLGTHYRSAIFHATDQERKEAQQSKIRRQMKLNRRIVTKIIPYSGEFYLAENYHQKYYLQKHCWLCESLSLRSTCNFVESQIACKLNGVLAMEGKFIIDELGRVAESYQLPKQSISACEEIIGSIKRNLDENIHKSTIVS